MTRLGFFVVLLLTLGGCASVTGYDAKRYENDPALQKPDADVDTEPLPPMPKRSIPDPRRALIRDAATP